jgi:hypothetical protein
MRTAGDDVDVIITGLRRNSVLYSLWNWYCNDRLRTMTTETPKNRYCIDRWGLVRYWLLDLYMMSVTAEDDSDLSNDVGRYGPKQHYCIDWCWRYGPNQHYCFTWWWGIRTESVLHQPYRYCTVSTYDGSWWWQGGAVLSRKIVLYRLEIDQQERLKIDRLVLAWLMLLYPSADVAVCWFCCWKRAGLAVSVLYWLDSNDRTR